MSLVLWKRHTQHRVWEVSVSTQLLFGFEVENEGAGMFVALGPLTFWTHAT